MLSVRVKRGRLVPAKLVSYAALISALALFMACSGEVPPKGSHDEVKPAAIPASQQPSNAPPAAAAAALDLSTALAQVNLSEYVRRRAD